MNTSLPQVTDRFARSLRDLRISVTDRCNFRCPYCMPAETFGERYEFLPRREILSFEEIARLARIFCELGVTKIRITGGEPLLRAAFTSTRGSGLKQIYTIGCDGKGLRRVTSTGNNEMPSWSR